MKQSALQHHRSYHRQRPQRLPIRPATARRLVQLYLDRIETYDKKGPAINAIITVNPQAIGEAERLDAAFETSGFVGSLHGIPVIMKDQGDAKGMPTTLGSVLFKDYYPQRDAFVVEKLKRAGAVILAKATSASSAVGIPMGLFLDRRAIPTIWSARQAVLPAARQPVSPLTIAPLRLDKMALHRFAGHRHGTRSAACARPPGWSVAAESTPDGHRRPDHSDR